MTITNRSAPASIEAPAPATITTTAVRRTGVALTLGATIWAAAMAAVGNNPAGDPGMMITDLGAVPFQLALIALVTVQLRTRATGLTRVSAGLLRVEYVLLALATIWSVMHGAVPAFRDDLWLAVLDAFWPLSMLGMAIIGVKVFFARRWQGIARLWPMVAESWVLVNLPVNAILGDAAVRITGPAHLLAGYAVLGLVLAVRPALTGAAAGPR